MADGAAPRSRATADRGDGRGQNGPAGVDSTGTACSARNAAHGVLLRSGSRISAKPSSAAPVDAAGKNCIRAVSRKEDRREIAVTATSSASISDHGYVVAQLQMRRNTARPRTCDGRH